VSIAKILLDCCTKSPLLAVRREKELVEVSAGTGAGATPGLLLSVEVITGLGAGTGIG
jgi:hypothetical protein